MLTTDETGVEQFRYPSYVQHIMGDIFSLGFGPFRFLPRGVVCKRYMCDSNSVTSYHLSVLTFSRYRVTRLKRTESAKLAKDEQNLHETNNFIFFTLEVPTCHDIGVVLSCTMPVDAVTHFPLSV